MKSDNRDSLKATLVKFVAKTEGVNERSVYRVLNAEQENEKVLDRYMIAKEYVETALVKAAKELVPIN